MRGGGGERKFRDKHSNGILQALIHLIFSTEEIHVLVPISYMGVGAEVQRGHVIGIRSHSQQAVEMGFERTSTWLQSPFPFPEHTFPPPCMRAFLTRHEVCPSATDFINQHEFIIQKSGFRSLNFVDLLSSPGLKGCVLHLIMPNTIPPLASSPYPT